MQKHSFFPLGHHNATKATKYNDIMNMDLSNQQRDQIWGTLKDNTSQQTLSSTIMKKSVKKLSSEYGENNQIKII